MTPEATTFKFRFACVEWSHRQRRYDCAVTMTADTEADRDYAIAQFLRGPFDSTGVPSAEHRFAKFEQ